MTNPAAEARGKVKAVHPEAVVVERGRNSIKHRLDDHEDGRQRFALDVAIGPFHYGPDNDQEIDTALMPSTAPWDWEMTKAGFEVRALSNLSAGQVIEYRSGSEWVRFQPMALQYSNDLNQIQQISMPQAVDATVDDDTLTWADGYGPGRSLSWQAQTARLAKLLTINALSDLPAVQQYILDGGNPVLELNLIFAFSGGVTPYVNGQAWGKGQAQDKDTQGLVEFRDDEGNILWWFNLPRSWDSAEPDAGKQLGTFRFKKQGNSLYVSHRVPLEFVQGAVYPLIVDVTVDEQVGASSDDAHELSAANPDIAGDNIGTLDTDNKFGGCRWPSVAVPKDDTIDVATCDFYFPGATVDEPLHDLDFEAHDDAPTFTTDADNISSRSLTGSAVLWDDADLGAPGWFTSPSLVTPAQAIVNRAGWVSGQAMVLVIVQPTTQSLRDWFTRTYDFDTTLAAKLHIEYTAGGGGVTVLAALATATALAPSATILTGLLVAGALATATALTLAAKHINTIPAAVATATARSWAATVAGAASIAAALATATAKSYPVTIITAGSVTVAGALATATALSYAAAVSGVAIIAGGLSTATARSWAAVINPGVVVSAAKATATALAHAATIVVEGVAGIPSSILRWVR